MIATKATVSDEAVQAFINTMHHSAANSYEQQVQDALTAALPHLTAPCSGEVKKLEWVGEDFKSTFSNEFIGYEIQKCEDDTGEHYAMNVRHYGSTYARRGTLEEAKAAAQADFERRILSAIFTKPVDVSAALNSAALVVEGRCTAINSEFIESLSHRRNYEVAEIVAEHDLKLGAAIRALSLAEPAQCQTCNSNGLIGGLVPWGDGEVDSIIEPCPDCSPAAPTSKGEAGR